MQGLEKIKMIKKEITELILLFSIVMFINTFILGVTTVSGESMNPSLENGDKLIIKKYGTVLKTEKYRYGDIVIFKSPLKDDKRLFVKRIIGTPRDKVEIRSGELYINDNYVEEEYIDKDSYTESLLYGSECLVPEDKFFVIGDNRFSGGSNDSRRFGCISADKIKGKVVFRFFPFNRIGNNFNICK